MAPPAGMSGRTESRFERPRKRIARKSAARRFYTSASAVTAEGGYGVALDERRLLTPGGAPFIAPTRALAEVCAAEWKAQGEHIVPASMPITQLAFAAIDRTAG